MNYKQGQDWVQGPSPQRVYLGFGDKTMRDLERSLEATDKLMGDLARRVSLLELENDKLKKALKIKEHYLNEGEADNVFKKK